MKYGFGNVVLFLVMCGVGISKGNTTYPMNTGKPGVTCSVRPLSNHELEWTFFKDKALRYTKDLMLWGAYRQDTSGTLLYLSQQENHDFLKHMHELYEAVEVTIKNESHTDITIPRMQYLKVYARAAVVAEEFVKQYPNFKKHTVLASIYASLLGLAGLAVATIGGMCIWAVCQAAHNRVAGGVGAGVFAIAALVPFILTASIAGRASALYKKQKRLRSLGPKLRTSQGVMMPLPTQHVSQYTIPAQSTFVDTLIIYRPHIPSAGISPDHNQPEQLITV
jgi:hypothetical protein